MKYNGFFIAVFFIVAVSLVAGCMSGDGENTTQAPTTQAPTTQAPTNSPETTAAPTTESPTITPDPLIHNECSTGYINFNEGNDRYYPCDSPDDPVELWETDTLMTQAPVLVDYDRAYLFQSNYGDYEIKCYNVFTGEEYWSVNVPFMELEDVLLEEGKIYLFQLDQPILRCYDAADGSLIWSSENFLDLYPNKAEIDLISMSYSDGKIIALLETVVNEGYINRDGSILCCFNASTGQLNWSNWTEDLIHSYPAIEGGTAYYTLSTFTENYAISNDHAEAIVGVNIDTGGYVLYKIIQEQQYNQRDIIISDGRIYVLTTRMDEGGHDGIPSVFNMYVLCLSTSGNIIWEDKLDEMAWGNLLLGNDKLFLTREGQIICYDINTHRKIWDTQIENTQYQGPVITNDKLIVFQSEIGSAPRVIALDPSNGSEIWSIELEGIQIAHAISFYEGMMLMATDLGHLYCFG